MNFGSHLILERKVIMRVRDRICENSKELLESYLFERS